MAASSSHPPNRAQSSSTSSPLPLPLPSTATHDQGTTYSEVAKDDHCKNFVQMFIGLCFLGSLVFLVYAVAYEATVLCPQAACLSVCCLSSLFVFVLSFKLDNLTVPLYLYCVIFDLLLTLVTLSDRNPRDMYSWFVCIPLLLLYARGVGSCLAAAMFVIVQTTLLRYVKEVLLAPLDDPFSSEFRHTLFGASYSDCWLFVLITMFSAGNHYSRSQVLKRLQTALDDRERANVKLRQATKAKTDFLANMSHELRTPMHGIIAMSRELQDMLPPNSKASHAVAIISDCADHLLSLVNDILDFERIESNQLEMEQIPFSVVCETSKVVNMLRFPAEKKHLGITTNIAVTHAQRIGDPVRFRQILFNLLSNAIKFTPERGSISVNLAGVPSSSHIELTVNDTGIGISEDNLSRLFSPFSQVDASVSRRYGGSGLGLAISKRLCDAMGGSIRCTSELGKGSSFTAIVNLPEVKDPEEQTADGQARHQDEGVAQEDVSKLKFDGLEVLLVEDNVVNQKVGKRMLHTLGCNVTVADNGVECVRLAEEKKFDIILMDCQMPIMDGFQATQRIRELEKSREEASDRKAGDARPDDVARRSPIVALTASATKEYGRKCLEVGMSDVLFKPLRREALAAALKKWIPDHRDATTPAPSSLKSASATTKTAKRSSSASSFPVLHPTPMSFLSSSADGLGRQRCRSLPAAIPPWSSPSAVYVKGLREEIEGARRQLVFKRKEST